MCHLDSTTCTAPPPQQAPRFVEVDVVGPAAEGLEALLRAAYASAAVRGAVGPRRVPRRAVAVLQVEFESKGFLTRIYHISVVFQGLKPGAFKLGITTGFNVYSATAPPCG
jgi:hypothetical protein